MRTGITPEDAEQELLWRRVVASAADFYFNYWFIQIPGKPAGRPSERPAQREALQTFQDERYVIALKARQIGWTTLSAAFAMWGILSCPKGEVRKVILLSRTEREAKKIKKRVAFGYANLPLWMKERGPKLISSTQQMMEFGNGCSIEALPSKSDPARSETAWLIIVDEWAFFDDPSDAWASIEPATNVGGRVIGFSTPKGYGSWFHRFYLDAKNGVSAFTSMFFSWRAVPERDEAWLEETRSNHQDLELFAQEYAEDDVSCWKKSGSMFFTESSLDDVEALGEPISKLKLRLRNDDTVYAVEHVDGELDLFEPIRRDAVYVVGADVAGGGAAGDWSVAQVLDRSTGVQVAMWRGKISPDEFGKRLYLIGHFFNEALVAVERNNQGVATLTTLKDTGYRKIYYDRPVLTRKGYQPRPKLPGWHTTGSTKPLMLGDLKGALVDEALTVTSKQTMEELWAFQAVIKKAKNGIESTTYFGSPHDDCVMALAIAWQMMKQVTAPRLEADPDEMLVEGQLTTFDQWRREQASVGRDRRIYSGRGA